MGTSESLTLPATTTMPSLSTAAGAAAAAHAHFSGILLRRRAGPTAASARFHGKGEVLGKIQLHPARRARASFSSLTEDRGAGKMHMLVAKHTYERD